MKFIKDNGGREKHFPCDKKKDRTNDCIARSISIATGLDWMLVMKGLFSIALKMGMMPNDYRVMEEYLLQLGWVKNKPFRKSNGKKYKVKDLPVNPDDRYIVKTSSHVTAITYGEHRDTWNCGAWSANSYYTKEVA